MLHRSCATILGINNQCWAAWTLREALSTIVQEALSTMSSLDQTLAQVRERVDRHRGSPIGEQNTKAALIEPILRALGWAVEDPEEVWREYRRRSSDNPVDYALLIL